jgi:glyceraldehyde 3-phosphate dehydrogenase
MLRRNINMARIGINGFGRIGRAIFRLLIECEDLEVVLVNDLNNDINNICYMINYDSIYGALKTKYNVESDVLVAKDHSFKVVSQMNISNVDWQSEGVDYLIESTGDSKNLEELDLLIISNVVKRVFITQSTQYADFEMVLGVNEDEFLPKKHNIISTSICDTTAVTPILKIINDSFTIKNGFLTTLHPYLSYQNLLDNRPVSWYYPGQTHGNYPLGRSAIGSLIPKMTTAIDASSKVIKEDYINHISSFSFRTPLQSIASAVLVLNLIKKPTKKSILDVIEHYISLQQWQVIKLSDEPLVSIDYLGSRFSSIIDTRWLETNDHSVRIVFWYDNEVGYSNNVVNQIRYVNNLEDK